MPGVVLPTTPGPTHPRNIACVHQMPGNRNSGRRPKPTALKQLQGNPGKRKLNLNEPKPPEGRPEMPQGLTREAKQEWKRIVPMLEQMGILTVADGKALAAYCASYAAWMQAERHIAKFGIVLATVDEETGQSYVKANPAVRIRGDALRLMKSFLTDFGLTPASRSRLHVNEPGAGNYAPSKSDDPLERFLSEARGAEADDQERKPN